MYNILEAGGYAQYLKTDAWTEKGIKEVVACNEWEDAWSNYTTSHTPTTTIFEKYSDLLRVLLVQRSKHDLGTAFL